jgi:hypothetical protein
MSEEPSEATDTEDDPTSDQIVAVLFQAAMSGNETKFAFDNEIDPKLLQMWKFTHAQEYITYLEKVLRLIKSRAAE